MTNSDTTVNVDIVTTTIVAGDWWLNSETSEKMPRAGSNNLKAIKHKHASKVRTATLNLICLYTHFRTILLPHQALLLLSPHLPFRNIGTPYYGLSSVCPGVSPAKSVSFGTDAKQPLALASSCLPAGLLDPSASLSHPHQLRTLLELPY